MLIITSSIFVHLAIISDYFSNKSLFGGFLKGKELLLYYDLFINSINFARTLGLAKYSYYIITVDSDSFHTIIPLLFTSTLFLCLLFLLVYALGNNKLIAEKALVKELFQATQIQPLNQNAVSEFPRNFSHSKSRESGFVCGRDDFVSLLV